MVRIAPFGVEGLDLAQCFIPSVFARRTEKKTTIGLVMRHQIPHTENQECPKNHQPIEKLCLCTSCAVSFRSHPACSSLRTRLRICEARDWQIVVEGPHVTQSALNRTNKSREMEASQNWKTRRRSFVRATRLTVSRVCTRPRFQCATQTTEPLESIATMKKSFLPQAHRVQQFGIQHNVE